MRVLKFGGTSVRDGERLRNAAAIVDSRRDGGAVVVVSAAAGMTRRLLELAATAARAPWRVVASELDEIVAAQRSIVAALDLESALSAEVAGRLAALAAELREVLRGLGDPDHCPAVEVGSLPADAAGAATPERCGDADEDRVMSFGERFSSALMVAAARRAALPVAYVPALDVIVTDATYRNAAPDREAIERRAGARIAPLLVEGAVVVTEGFIGATLAGAVTTMGFEASDLTATLLGAALDAEQVQIWTDVPGMLTTGHASVPAPRRVPRLTYEEAAELALFGARVLHPDTVAPARDKGIPVRILHAADPSGEGTWITADGQRGGEAGRGAPIVKAIAVAADADDDSFATVRELLTRAAAGEPGNRAVVCPVGRGIGNEAAMIERVDKLIEGFPSAVRLPRRPHAIPVVVVRRRVDEMVRRLHAELL